MRYRDTRREWKHTIVALFCGSSSRPITTLQYICQSPHHHHKVESSTDNDPFKVNSSDHQHSNHYHRYIAKHVTTGVSQACWMFVICICVYGENEYTPNRPLRPHSIAYGHSLWLGIDISFLKKWSMLQISDIIKQVWFISLNDWFKCMNVNKLPCGTLPKHPAGGD